MIERKKVVLIIVWFLVCFYFVIRDIVFEYIFFVLNVVFVVFYGFYVFIFYKVYKYGKYFFKCW